MLKIPTIFMRDWLGDRSRVTSAPNVGCDWVFRGEGVATRKYDGTCCMFDGAKWWKRREVKPGKPAPDEFVPVATDETTGKRVGWMPVDAADKWHMEAIQSTVQPQYGTYELIGPKVQGNPEGAPHHMMVLHSAAETVDPPRSYFGLRDWLAAHPFEGVVFHHADGRMAKIKRRDFGIK